MQIEWGKCMFSAVVKTFRAAPSQGSFSFFYIC